jgi:hypothetical protein
MVLMKGGTDRRRATAAVVLVLAVWLSICAQAFAEKRTYRVCRDTVSLRHAPAGVKIGSLRRGTRVIVTLYARRHRWAYVLSAEGHGWLLTSGLCRRS